MKYDFELALKPLFITYEYYYDDVIMLMICSDGKIAPCKNKEDIGPFPFNKEEVIKKCQECQQNDLKSNEEFRKANNLLHRYEYNHFFIEVLNFTIIGI